MLMTRIIRSYVGFCSSACMGSTLKWHMNAPNTTGMLMSASTTSTGAKVTCVSALRFSWHQ